MLDGKIVEISSLCEEDKVCMFNLMDMFYENMVWDIFLSDLSKKDYCILLTDEEGEIRGFSTQQLITVDVADKKIHGVFSGDTIVHKDYWKTRHPLFSLFGTFFERYSRDYDEFYWFLIVKGYKTYKILPTFFNTFYPNCDEATPQEVSEIIDAFGRAYSPDYNCNTGVVEYKTQKDMLRQGVADIGERAQKNKHTSFFLQKNPDYIRGYDLVCLTSLKKQNYQKSKDSVLWR